MYAWFMRCGECNQPTHQVNFINYIGHNFSGHDGHLYPTPSDAYKDLERFYDALRKTVSDHKGILPRDTPYRIVSTTDRCQSPDYRHSEAEESEQYRTRGGHWLNCPFDTLEEEIVYFAENLVLVTIEVVK